MVTTAVVITCLSGRRSAAVAICPGQMVVRSGILTYLYSAPDDMKPKLGVGCGHHE